MKLADAQLKALNILRETTYDKRISCRGFAKKMWPDSNMHTSSKNTGNGSCRGKAAWLCAGSYLAKLRKKGWANDHGHEGWYLTVEGRRIIRNYIIPIEKPWDQLSTKELYL